MNAARALNSIFKKWDILANPTHWNISGELCTGRAIDTSLIDDTTFNPLIKCDCSYDNRTTCRITALYLFYFSLKITFKFVLNKFVLPFQS